MKHLVTLIFFQLLLNSKAIAVGEKLESQQDLKKVEKIGNPKKADQINDCDAEKALNVVPETQSESLKMLESILQTNNKS